MTTPRALSVFVLVALVGSGTPSAADYRKCQRAIVRESAREIQLRAKFLERCEERIVKGHLAGPCPDEATKDAIDVIADRFSDQISKACGGDDRACGTSDNEVTPATLGWPATCPRFEGICTHTISDCGQVSACIHCVVILAMNQAMALYHDALNLPSANDPDLNDCQVAIGRASVRYLIAKSKALRKCWQANLTVPGACPDAGTSAKIASAYASAQAAICKACGGADQLCTGTDGFTPAAIGFPTSCPPVTGTMAGDCGAIGTIDDLSKLAQCATCVTDFKTDCMHAVQLPYLTDYPPGCVDPLSTPTPTVTPTPIATPTGPTPTGPTPVATRTPDGCCQLANFCANMPPGEPGDCTIQGGAYGPGSVCYLDSDQSGCPFPGSCGHCGPPAP